MLAFRCVLSVAILYLCQVVAMGADPKRIHIPGVTNAFRVTDHVLSGSEPGGERTFAALIEMGVAVVVSVDGKKPDLDAATRHGLRYVHLPIGYDGVSAERQVQLAQAARLLGKGEKIYLHCHHGKHRGPAAVGILGRDTEEWSAEEAEHWLHTAGTAKVYEGLFRDVRDWKPAGKEQLANADGLPAISETPGIVEAMVALDQHLDDLKAIQRAGWQSPADAPDVSALTVATLLWETYREAARLPEARKRPQAYRKLLGEGEAAAARLRKAIQSGKPLRKNEALKLVRQSCVSCHKRYRD